MEIFACQRIGGKLWLREEFATRKDEKKDDSSKTNNKSSEDVSITVKSESRKDYSKPPNTTTRESRSPPSSSQIQNREDFSRMQTRPTNTSTSHESETLSQPKQLNPEPKGRRGMRSSVMGLFGGGGPRKGSSFCDFPTCFSKFCAFSIDLFLFWVFEVMRTRRL